jgi:U4/U6 small nuclear ribonucleoprotein PRP4
MVLDGHIRDILSIDWSPATGYQLATGSNDDSVKLWDLRMIRMLYSIPAHRSTVSDVKFFKAEDGLKEFPKTIVDKKTTEAAKPNGHTNGTAEPAIKQEEEEEDVKPDISAMDTDKETKSAPAGWGRQAQPDVPISGMYLATSGYDGYVKLWSADDWQLVKSLNSEAGGKVMSVDLSGGESLSCYGDQA